MVVGDDSGCVQLMEVNPKTQETVTLYKSEGQWREENEYYSKKQECSRNLFVREKRVYFSVGSVVKGVDM